MWGAGAKALGISASRSSPWKQILEIMIEKYFITFGLLFPAIIAPILLNELGYSVKDWIFCSVVFLGSLFQTAHYLRQISMNGKPNQ